MHCERIEPMISGYIDNELTQQEAQRVQVHLGDCATCRQVHQQLLELKQQVGGIDYPDAEELDLQRLEAIGRDPVVRFTAAIGWTLLIATLLVASGTALFLFMTGPEVPVLAKLFHGGLILGGAALFVSVLRQQLISRKTDKYTKVKL